MIRPFIERHFTLVMLLSCVAGLVVPGIAVIPNRMAVFVLAALMFFSCYRLRDGRLHDIRWRDIAVFYGLRYMLLPVAMWAIATVLAPRYALSVFLLSVVPAGVSSPAIATIYGGVIVPGFAIVILSQLAAPLLIPLQFAWLGDVSVAPSPASLFATMVWSIFVPMLIYAAVRRHRSAAYFYRNGTFFSILLVAFTIMFAIGKQRDIILANLPQLVQMLAVSLLCFAVYIVFGWLLAFRRPRAQRITYATCSGFNNTALCVSLALLHFSPDVIVFVAVSEIGWALLPAMMRLWLRFNP